ncbi:MAG: hypothetical protein QXY45_01430 [Candidatus Aenigmatarchaeota archaeon]
MKKTTTIAIIFLLLFPIILGQEFGVKITHYGFGKNPQEIKFAIHSTGEETITGVSIFIDGQKIKEFNKMLLEPRKGVSLTLNLEPGIHQIEVRTPEGAYDSINVTVSGSESINYHSPEENKISFTKTKIFKIAIILLIISVVVIWFLMRKPKLELSL